MEQGQRWGDSILADLDEKSLTILRKLLENSKVSQRELATTLGIGPPKVNERIDAMRARGIIKRFTIEVDYSKLGFDTLGFFSFKLKRKAQEEIEEVESFLLNHPQIIEVHRVFGEQIDYLVKIQCQNNNELLRVGGEITRLNNVSPEHCFTSPVATGLKSMPGVKL